MRVSLRYDSQRLLPAKKNQKQPAKATPVQHVCEAFWVSFNSSGSVLLYLVNLHTRRLRKPCRVVGPVWNWRSIAFTEPSAVAPDRRLPNPIKRVTLRPSTDLGRYQAHNLVDSSIRRYRARFCKSIRLSGNFLDRNSLPESTEDLRLLFRG
jgi:hypothetical protein